MRWWKMLLAVVAYLYANHALALGGIADLSVYDRTEGRQLQVHWHEGRAYVVGKPGNEYQVTLRNDSYRNLLARGVIRQPVPFAPRRRPFPDFVPDPRG